MFVNENDHYKLILKTINLSEDGGKIIGDITSTQKDNEVFKIHTFFPDGGNLQATHYISYSDDEFFLKRTLYETSNWRENNDVYICNIEQNILLKTLNSPGGFENFKRIPSEEDRDRLCTKNK